MVAQGTLRTFRPPCTPNAALGKEGVVRNTIVSLCFYVETVNEWQEKLIEVKRLRSGATIQGTRAEHR